MTHDSIKILLDSLERDGRRRLTHSELARALNVSEQVVTNWAKRGISAEGALTAQYAFGKDANFLLGRVSHPMMHPRHIGSETANEVRESRPPYLLPAQGAASRAEADLISEIRTLNESDKKELLSFVKIFVAGKRSHAHGQDLQVAS